MSCDMKVFTHSQVFVVDDYYHRHSANDVKSAEATRRKLSLDLVTESARIEAKHREGLSFAVEILIS